MKSVIAVRDGFYNGSRVKAETRFDVPDSFKSNKKDPWFVLESEYKPIARHEPMQIKANATRRESESFITLMKRAPVVESAPGEPETEDVPKGKRGRASEKEVI